MDKCDKKPECPFVAEFGGWCARCDAEAHGDAHLLPEGSDRVWVPPPQLELPFRELNDPCALGYE